MAKLIVKSHYAAYRIGKKYLKGEIMKKDMGKALRYLTDAANAENQYAQYLLGKLYLAGSVTKRDIPTAEYWFSQSARQGNQYAQFFLDRMCPSRQPPSCCQRPGFSATWRIYSGITRCQKPDPWECGLTASVCKSSGRRKSPWATSRTTMRNTPAPPCLCKPPSHWKHCLF